MGPTVKEYQWRVINTMIGGTTFRNQGAPGVEAAARAFLGDMDLTRFVTDCEEEFQRELDEQTEALRLALPLGAQNWGAARKALNLVLAEAQYHRHLCAAYGLDRIVGFLEIPLDRLVGDYLWRTAWANGVRDVPRWETIKRLTPERSVRYQVYARELAAQRGEGWARVHLDVLLWRARADDSDPVIP